MSGAPPEVVLPEAPSAPPLPGWETVRLSVPMLPPVADGRQEQVVPVRLHSGLGSRVPLTFSFDVYPARRPAHPERHLGVWSARAELPPGDHNLRVRFAHPQVHWELEREGAWVALPLGESWVGQPSGVTGDGLYQLNVWVDLAGDTPTHIAHTVREQVLHWRDLKPDDVRWLLDREWAGPERRHPLPTSSDPVVMEAIARATRDFALDLSWEPPPAVLDLGCGQKPYWPYFWGRCRQYVGVDTVWSPEVDLLVDGDSPLPFADESFEVVLCHQVLEHARDPWGLVREAHRVLVPGGAFLVSAPFVWEVHDYPADYWRYSEQGLRELLRDFAEVRTQPCGNTQQALLQTGAAYLLRGHQPPSLLTRELVRLIGLWARGPAGRSRDALLPANHIALAHKALAGGPGSASPQGEGKGLEAAP